MPSVVSPDHLAAAGRVRDLLATYAESEDLINIGAYKTGANQRVDWALKHLDAVRAFMMQKVGESSSFAETVNQIVALAPEEK